ncbi:transposase family protein [Streptomyces sp. NPDC001508]|uniref:transposase family protein n=1 Tax=Streptomyces sp. NPDC001508 TaxID=3154656 RepID=UPI00331C1716
MADLGFVGLDGGGDDSSDPAVVTGYKKPKGKKLPSAKKQANQLIAAERAVCEHGFAHLENWRVLTRLRLDVRWATRFVQATVRACRRCRRSRGAHTPPRSSAGVNRQANCPSDHWPSACFELSLVGSQR